MPDYIINPHPRFAALTRNIRERRGKKVDIRVPLFRDINTPEFQGDSEKGEPPMIDMDAMAFGMGMCCLQVTFQARDVDESRYMYDQMAVLAPILMAMTAASPFFRGRLADIDARWTVIAQSVDDRTDAEQGLISPDEAAAIADPLMAGQGIRRIPKSRYDSISTFIYHCKGDPACSRTFSEYNDISCPIEKEFWDVLREQGIDENLTHHLCHLFIRDPLVAFHGQIESVNDEESTDHFESIQSTNWQTCRWKPPPPHLHENDPHIGWRAEFRSMEVQLTDFENAAFTVLIVLLTRVMLAFDVGFYIPLSKVDENMRRAHGRDAVNKERFFFRRHIAPPPAAEENGRTLSKNGMSELKAGAVPVTAEDDCGCAASKGSVPGLPQEDAYEEMTMAEIFQGKEDYYPGLLPLIYAYLEFINVDPTTMNRVSEYLQFIEKRATGELMTPATWMRHFIMTHPEYAGDSVISPAIAHDVMVACHQIGTGERSCPELLGDVRIDR